LENLLAPNERFEGEFQFHKKRRELKNSQKQTTLGLVQTVTISKFYNVLQKLIRRHAIKLCGNQIRQAY